MRCALISDIHANKYALRAVMASVHKHRVDTIVNAGDTFGYYPWAAEVFAAVEALMTISVIGNHDALILDSVRPPQLPGYWDAIEQNRRVLPPRAMVWLRSLPLELDLCLDGRRIRVVHGTPDEPLTGRLYPDYRGPDPLWLPATGEVLVLGHTHYPMVRGCLGEGLLLNPGSVGQPRDGDPRASWMLLDTDTLAVELVRVAYDHHAAMRELSTMGWNERSIRVLNKLKNTIVLGDHAIAHAN